jgi:hypothetical protein
VKGKYNLEDLAINVRVTKGMCSSKCAPIVNDHNSNPIFLLISKLKVEICSYGQSFLSAFVIKASFTLNVIPFWPFFVH